MFSLKKVYLTREINLFSYAETIYAGLDAVHQKNLKWGDFMGQSFRWHREAEAQWDERVDFWNERSRNMWNNGSRKDIIPFIDHHLKKAAVY